MKNVNTSLRAKSATLASTCSVPGAKPIVVACLIGASAGACLAAKPDEFSIREAEPTTGSRLLRSIVSGWDVPVNKTYPEFTPEQKDKVRALYEAMPPGDEPPFPAEGLKPVYSALAQAQQQLLVEGDLTLVATVAATGEVSQVEVVGRSPDRDLTQVASSVVLLTKFKPAVCSGKPCQMDFPFRFRFTRR